MIDREKLVEEIAAKVGDFLLSDDALDDPIADSLAITEAALAVAEAAIRAELVEIGNELEAASVVSNRLEKLIAAIRAREEEK